MKFITHSHRNGWELLQSPEFVSEHRDIVEVISSITDDDIIRVHSQNFLGTNKSISRALNKILRERFVQRGWQAESPIFQDPEYSQKRDTIWRLDLAKNTVSVEVAYNHGEALAWNLLKPVLASELNHVRKAIQTRIGVVVLATEDLKDAGGFDSAVGTYEKAIRYLKPLQNQLSVPLVLVGLGAPEGFRVEQIKVSNKTLARFRSMNPPFNLLGDSH
jgi:hypothetical protein